MFDKSIAKIKLLVGRIPFAIHLLGDDDTFLRIVAWSCKCFTGIHSLPSSQPKHVYILISSGIDFGAQIDRVEVHRMRHSLFTETFLFLESG